MPDSYVKTMDNTWLSSLSALKPNKLRPLFEKNGKQGYESFLLVKALGWTYEVDNEDYSHWEDLRIHQNFESKTTVGAPGAGNHIEIILASANLTASNEYYPRIGDDIPFGNGSDRVMGCIRDIDDTSDPTAPVLYIEPKITTAALPGVTAGDTLFIISNSHGEGTDQPDPRLSAVQEISNQLKIIKETVGTTGTALSDNLWFAIPWAKIYPGLEGAPRDSYYRKSYTDMEYRMALSIGGALMFDEITTNTALVDATYGTLRAGTRGLVPSIQTYGTSFTHTPGTLQVADFNYFDKVLVQQHVTTKNILFWLGTNLYHELEDLMKDYADSSDEEYISKKVTQDVFGGNYENMVSVDFSCFKKSARIYNFKRNYDWDNLETYGSTGYDYSDMGVIIPLGTQKNKMNGMSEGTFGYRYKKLNDLNREFEAWEHKGTGKGLKILSVDRVKSYMRAHIGGHQIAMNQAIIVES